MEKLLKLSLSIMCIYFFVGCQKTRTLTREEKIALAEQKYNLILNDEVDGLQGSVTVMALLDEIIDLNPQHCDALRERSVAYLKRGIPHEWKIRMDQAVACDPARWIGWRGYLYLYFYRDYKKAIEDFNATDTLIAGFIDNPQGHSVDYWRGHAYLGLKNYNEAIRYYKKHIQKVIEDFGEEWVEPDAFLNLGTAYLENRQHELAHEQLLKALLFYDNQSAETKYHLALLEQQLDNSEQAIIWINAAMTDFLNGHSKKRPYTEEIGQVYWDQLNALKQKLISDKPK